MIGENMRGFFAELGIGALVVAGALAAGTYSLGYHNAQKKAETEKKELREKISALESRPIQTNLFYVVDALGDMNSISADRHDRALKKAKEYAEQLNYRQATKPR